MEQKINSVLDKLRPFLINDGGDIELVKFEDGIAYIKFMGACADCGLQNVTLNDGTFTKLIILKEDDNMKDKEKNIAFFILISFSFLFFEIIYPLLGFNYNNFSPRTKLLLLILKYIIFIVILFIRYRKYLIDKWKDFKKNLDNYSGTAFKWWALGFLLMMVVKIRPGK